VKIVRFEASRAITHFDSHGMTIGGIARCSGETRLSLVELDPGGVVGLHQAVSPQLFLVVEGEGYVRGADGNQVAIARGQGAFWDDGELHETVTETGLVAIVIEAEALELLS
jgi:mannose-6-phosphate isomerase-like protein (cupin superfamily)